MLDLTTAGPWELCEAQESVIAWDRFKGDIAVPFSASALLLQVAVFVECFPLSGTDDADLVVLDAVLATGVGYWVDVQPRGTGLA